MKDFALDAELQISEELPKIIAEKQSAIEEKDELNICLTRESLG
jgi:hypothetical protein